MARLRFPHSNRRHHNWLIYKFADHMLEENIPFYKGTLYDLGCGEAPYKDFFLKHADNYVGVDWTATLHNSKADVVADLNKPFPIESNVADTIISLSVMEHLCEPQNMLNEAFRILKPGGTLMLQVPWQWRIHEAPHDYFRYTPYALQYMLGKAGFTNIEVKHQSGFFSMWFIKLNYFTNRIVKGPRLLRMVLQLPFLPLWYTTQILGPLLDKIDPNPAAEATGYKVRAFKQ